MPCCELSTLFLNLASPSMVKLRLIYAAYGQGCASATRPRQDTSHSYKGLASARAREQTEVPPIGR